MALRLGDVVVKDGLVRNTRTKESVPLKGVRLAVETAGQIDKRVTATRLLLTGPFAFGLRKKKDSRELFLVVEGDGGSFVVEVEPKKHKDALQFAAKVNEAAKREAAAAPTPAPMPVAEPPGTTGVDVIEQLERLGRLRETGVLTEEEFEAQKAALLRPTDAQ